MFRYHMEIITAWKKLLSYWSHRVHTAGGSHWKTEVKKNEKQRPAGSYFWCLSCIKSYYLSLCFILGERLFSPCTLSQITSLAPPESNFCLFLLKTDTTKLNPRIFILGAISGLKIHHSKLNCKISNHKRKNQINHWETNQ